MKRKIGAVVRLVAVCVLVTGVGTITASADEETGERCRRECQKAKDERDEICRGLPTRKAREKCWRSSNEQYAACVKKCAAGPQ